MSEFHKWVRTAPDWVIAAAQSDLVYKAMELAFKAGKHTASTGKADNEITSEV